ncbi:hypothetical protein D3C80_1902370 [compost metagenome]
MLQRGFLGFGILDQIGYFAHLRIHTGPDYHSFAGAACNHRAHEADIFLVTQR